MPGFKKLARSLVIGLAVVVLLRAILARSARWMVLSAAGLAFLALAYLAGAQYVAALHKGALSLMGNAWLAGIVTYGIGWWLGRREEHASTRAAGPDTRPAATTQTGVRK
jgi:hypothetical protein